MTTDAAQELLGQLCADLRLLWVQAGGPTLRALSLRTKLSKSQLGNILNGQIRQPPDWHVVNVLITAFLRYAQEHGRSGQLSISTGVEEFWRPRYAVVQYACGQAGGRRASRTPVTAKPDIERRPHPVLPHQLPGAVRHFVGRNDELQTLTKLIDPGAEAGGLVVISTIDGTAGIGKTALAVHWAHQVADRYPDGQLYVNLRGFDPAGSPMTAAEALRGFFEVFGLPPGQIPAGVEAQAGLYRSLLFDKRILVLLDNARDAEQVRPLLPGSPTALAVVTSRDRLTSLVAAEGANAITLNLLTTAQARELLARRLGPDRIAVDPAAVDEIITRCARLPLALAIVAARAGADPRFPLAALAAELRDTEACLDFLDGGDAKTDVRTVLSWSYRRLSTEAARLFRLLGLHPGPDLAVIAAASLAGVPAAQARRLLAELTGAHLLTEHVPGRFTFHDLLRAYAVELAHANDGEPERRVALDRMLDHYLQTAQMLGSVLTPLRESVAVGPARPGVLVTSTSDRQQALSWYTTECPVLLGAIRLAADVGSGAVACQLAWILAGILHLRGQWPERVSVQRTALAAASRLGVLAWQARAHRDLIGGYAWLDRFDDSRIHSERALRLYGELGDDVGLARTHRAICLMWERQGRYAEALDHARQSRDLFLRTDDRAGQAYAFNSIGWYHGLVGDYDQARSNCDQAVILLRAIGDRDGEATALDSLGYALHHLGEHQQAIDCYRQTLSLLRELGDRPFEAPTLDHLGDTYEAIGDHAAALDCWERALIILEDLQLPEAAVIRAKIQGHDRTYGCIPASILATVPTGARVDGVQLGSLPI